MAEVLYDGPVDTPDEIMSFAYALDKVLQIMKPTPRSSDMDARTMLLYTLVHSPIASHGRSEIKLPHLIERSGQMCSASLVISTRDCKLVWRGANACFEKKLPIAGVSNVRMTMESIQPVAKLGR